MQHQGTCPLKTHRLLLRRLSVQDAHAMFTGWAGDPQIFLFMRRGAHRDETMTHALLAAWEAAYAKPDYYHWGIVEQVSGQLIGEISLFDDRYSAGSARNCWRCTGLDGTDGVWSPGYCIGKSWQGQGFATEALRAVVDYWFSVCGGTWLAGCHATENPASGCVLRHIGFQFDHSSMDRKFDGTPVECNYYNLPLPLWETMKKENTLERID